jgi:hypothetical protein
MSLLKRVTTKDLVDICTKWEGESEEIDCDINLEINGIKYHAYTVSVSYRDLLFYTDTCDIQYLVDSYGDKNYAVIHGMTNK